MPLPMPARTARRSLTIVAVVSALVVLVLSGAVPIGPSPTARSEIPLSGVTRSVSSDLSHTFAERAGYAADRAGLVADAAPASGSRLLVVTFQPRDPSLYTPPSPGAPPLTMTEIADRYGLTPAQYSTVESYFVTQGLTVVHTWPDRLSLSLEGPTTSVDRAFGTTLLAGTYEGHTVSFSSTPPSLPPPIQSRVASVLGLSSGFDSYQFPALVPTAGGVPNGVAPSLGSSNLVTPAIARQIYGLSSLYNRSGGPPQYASSRGLAVMLWGPGYVPADLTTFFSQYYPSGFPPPSIQYRNVAGAPAPSASAANDQCGAAEELTLDMEWAGSMAPGATLYAVYAPEGTYPNCSPSSSTMAEAMLTAIGLPIAALSMSFGTPESSDTSLRTAWTTYLSEAAQLGITPLAATGDLGGDASAGCPGVPSVQYPSSSPDVIAVGGTDVTLTRNLLGQVTGFSETAWNDSGGGFSTQFPAPSWQQLGNPNRGEPDVSATAADNFLYFNGQPAVAGGTSFSTPLWAGLVTEMEAQYGKPLVPLAPRLYSIGTEEPSGKIGEGLADITSGSTCLGSAGPGWDEETGWGSPRALNLYEDLTATFVALSVGVAPSATGPGGSVTVSAHLANATSGAPIAQVPVALSLTSSTNLGPCTGSFGSAFPITGPSGNVSVTMSVPACYLGSSATVRATVQSSGLYGTNSTRVPVNLLAFVPVLSGLTTYPYSVLGFAGIIAVASVIGYFLGRPRRRWSSSANPPPSRGSPRRTPSDPPSRSTAPSPTPGAAAPSPGGSSPRAGDPAPAPAETATEAPKTT